MIKTKELQNFISRYYLGGLINSVMLFSDGESLTVRGMNDTHDVVAIFTHNDIIIPEGDFPIYDSSALIAMLNVMDEEIDITISTNKSGEPSALVLKGKRNKATFVLAHASALPKAPTVALLPEAHLTFDITEEYASQFIKANAALVEAPIFVAESNGLEAALTLNYEATRNTSRIELPLPTEIFPKDYKQTPIPTLYFKADLFSAILKANMKSLKDAPGRVYISAVKSGFARITFPEFDITYYLVGQDAPK